MSESRIDSPVCEDLVTRILSGEREASTRLIEYLWRDWMKIVRVSASMGTLSQSADHVHEVVARLVEKIGNPDGSGLRLFFPWKERHAGKDFGDWIRIVTKNVVRDYVREQMGTTRLNAGEFSPKRLLNEFSNSLDLEQMGNRPPMTAAQTARELLEFARNHLSKLQLSALRLWLDGASPEEMAAELQVNPGEAQRLLRAGIAALRRHFADSGNGG